MPSPAAVSRVQSLFVRYLPALRGFVTSLVVDYSLVDDVVQETFITVTAKADSFEPGTNFKAWTWTIARHKTLQALHTARRQRRLSDAAIESLCAQDESLEWEEAETAQRHLDACVDELAPKARLAVELRYRHAHRVGEVARRMGWTANAVHVALSRARKVLRDCVERRLAAQRPVG
jgi:RNA polymerase sigma-70 factor (ECF subfamily)